MSRSAVVADRVAMFRIGLGAVLAPLDVEVVAETALGYEVTRLAESEDVELVIVGAIDDMSRAEAVRRVKRLRNQPTVCVLLSVDDRDEVSVLRGLGTEGIVVRTAGPEELTRSFEQILKGERVLDEVFELHVDGDAPPPSFVLDEPLTMREREVLALLSAGRSNREIASAMYVSVPTVKTHLAHIYAKLGASNRNEALGRAVALGLLV